MQQPVLNLETAKLSKPMSPRHSAAVDSNPACHNHQPLCINAALHCWRNDLQEALILPHCYCQSM